MPGLEKARLIEITSDTRAQPIGAPIEVQFNPASLKLNVTNAIEGAVSRGRQARQFVGASSSSLSMELVFDTADEGSTDAPRSVAEKTAAVERFALPKPEGDKQSVPKLRFHWGRLIFDGVLQGINIDFEHFASDGTPLRAKVGVQIKEQNANYQLLHSGPGAARKGSAALPGAASFGASAQASLGVSASASLGAGATFDAQVGGQAGGQVGVALAGETAAEFAARVGVDPNAWRGLQADLSAGLTLDAGAEVGFDLGLSASGGLGVTTGVDASADVSVEAAFGLPASSTVSASASASASTQSPGSTPAAAVGAPGNGFTLAAAGGVAKAVAAVDHHHAAVAVSTTQAAFADPSSNGAEASAAAGVPPRPAGSHQARPPLRQAATQRGRAANSVPSAVSPGVPPGVAAPGTARGEDALVESTSRVDPRAQTFGRGVPLRPLARAAQAQHAYGGDAPFRLVPTVPPWQALPPRDAGRRQADAIQAQRYPARPCGCDGDGCCGDGRCGDGCCGRRQDGGRTGGDA